MNTKELKKLWDTYSKSLDEQRIKEENEMTNHYNRELDSMRRDLKKQIEIEDKFKKELKEYESKGFFYKLFNPPPFRSHSHLNNYSYFSLTPPYEEILRIRTDFNPKFEGFINWLEAQKDKKPTKKKSRSSK